ncbi:MAG TPA: hypothetical protein VFG53_09980 [Anaeromyxobacter sp.]|nr:hypothetical protein [Anaeromyxobacter sp.]
MGKTGFRMKSLRLMQAEMSIINRACAALDIDRARLMADASFFHAMRLGVQFSADPPRRLKESWPYVPPRGEEPTGVRVSITMDILLDELVGRAARLVHTSEPSFILGSTLAYIGRLQKCFTGESCPTPEEAAEKIRKLRAIRLPAQYEYRRDVKS